MVHRCTADVRVAGYAAPWLRFGAVTGSSSPWWLCHFVPLRSVDSDVRLYNSFHLYDTGLRAHSSPTSPFDCPSAIFLLRNFFVGLPKDILESARIDRRERDP